MENVTTMSVRAVAFYLPQFYPIPENDQWWGKGFTEWTNVTRARPLFRDHHQPRVPAELGLYDLRDVGVRIAQATMARKFGVEGFCYWHYWFGNGRRILQHVFDDVLKSGTPDFPFCLAWANQSWTGTWYGRPSHTLVEQSYPGDSDYEQHFAAIAPAFHDRRYIKVNGKPLFVVFEPLNLPDGRHFAELWRNLAVRSGLSGLYLVGMTTGKWKAADHGFDAETPHMPWSCINNYSARLGLFNKLRRKASRLCGLMLRHPIMCSYQDLIRHALPQEKGPNFLPCVMPNWDNTPRCGRRGIVVRNSSPALFKEHVADAIAVLFRKCPDERILFIKAWNEWAEGNYLEPDSEFGTGYLEALREVL